MGFFSPLPSPLPTPEADRHAPAGEIDKVQTMRNAVHVAGLKHPLQLMAHVCLIEAEEAAHRGDTEACRKWTADAALLQSTARGRYQTR